MISTFRFLLIALSGIPIYLSVTYFLRSVRQKLLIKETAVGDLPLLGESRLKGQKLQGIAVICGGSICGLAAARVCHDHFERVIIVEPEAWLAIPEGWDPKADSRKNNRSRIVQYHSIQAFQPFGFMALKKLFPHFEEECGNFDIRVLPADFSPVKTWGHTTPSPFEYYEGNLPKTMFASRHGIETVLRKCVMGKNDYPNIEQIVGTVTGVKCSPRDPTLLEEVTVHTKKGDMTLPATLVVDCTGTSRAGLKWLQRAGFDLNDSNSASGNQGLDQLKLVYDQKVHYTTLEFYMTPDIVERLPAACRWDEVGLIYGCATDVRFDGNAVYAQRIEKDKVHICCGTRGDVEPPRTIDGVKAFTRTLVVEKPIDDWFYEFLDVIAEIEDTMAVSVVHVAPTSYVQYHKAPKLPSNWIAIGDSVMTVNPVYGQGNNKAILGATTLNTVLRSVQASAVWPADFSRKFFEMQAARIEPIWLGTKLLDYDHFSTIPVSGENKSSHGAFLRWYVRRLRSLSFHDKHAALAWWTVIMFLAPGIDYFHPVIVLKVLWSCVKTPIL
ncbi:hypothetical protein L208DRAFT_1390284 [Tricholoma matsutake]|nr:hypothetical protein L208DRAFT_1390284 [Tricholoma matsutake 945]